MERQKDREAIAYLEQARDYALQASKPWIALVHSYLSRIYASEHDNRRFRQATEVAERFAPFLVFPEEDEEGVFYTKSSILAERSAGYLALSCPQKALDMKSEVEQQIQLDGNARLGMWMQLDWAQAHLQLNNIEECVTYLQVFVRKAQMWQSGQAFTCLKRYLPSLEPYSTVAAVREFKEELHISTFP